MIYLDYAATTPVSQHVLSEDQQFNKHYFANPNSVHALGLEALQIALDTSQKILSNLGLKDYEVVYTSGATESNNLALKGVCLSRKGGHIVTTPFEHGSITATLNYLASLGYVVDVVDIDKDGLVDLDNLRALVNEDTVLVSIGLVNSELGVVQNLQEIKTCLEPFPGVVFHSDMTQAIGKLEIDDDMVDLISLSGHKIYGYKGIGALLVKSGLKLSPLIHGGHSLSNIRSGTPPLSLIYSLGVAIDDAYRQLSDHNLKVFHLKSYLINLIKSYDYLVLNSPDYSVPHIVNISMLGYVGADIQKFLSDNQVYVSTTSACSSGAKSSRVVKVLTGDDLRANGAIRISLSHLTTTKELDKLVDLLEVYHESR